jgi:hypothetical protein
VNRGNLLHGHELSRGLGTKPVMGRRSEALIAALLLIALAGVIVALFDEERRGCLVLAITSGALAAYAWYRQARRAIYEKPF